VTAGRETVTVIVPAYREAGHLATTVAAVRGAAATLEQPIQLIVVDDGSDDGTAEEARGADLLLRMGRNQGKGAAVTRGLACAQGEWIVLLDADLGETAAQFPRLLAPVQAGEADMTIAIFGDLNGPSSSDIDGPPEARLTKASGHQEYGAPAGVAARRAARGGFGLALRTARWGVAQLTGRVLTAPLSGQRALRGEHLRLLLPLEPGFGLEVAMDIDALRAGLRVKEVPTTMRHAATGRDWAGFHHRGRQMAHILRALWVRRKSPTR
jgi:glycosyl transferase family 2